MFRSITLLTAMGCAASCFAADIPAPVVDNVTVYDANGDGIFESISSISQITAHWRNVNYLDQRWTRRGVIEVDLGAFPSNSRLESAELSFYIIGRSNTPDMEFWGYPGDGIADLDDAQSGDVKMNQQVFDANGTWTIDISDYARMLIQQGHRYLGINVRAASEGRTNNTYDDEIVFNGYQSTSQVFPGVSATLSDTIGSETTPADTLYQHAFDWIPIEEALGFTVSSSNVNGRNSVVLNSLRMDQRAPFSIDNRNQLDWVINLDGAQDVSLSFEHQEFGDELHEMPDTYVDAVDADGIALSNDGVTWYRVLSASDLDVGARGTGFDILLDQEVDRIRSQFDPAFGFGPEFRIRFQQFDNSSAPDDGRHWASLRVVGTPPQADVDLSVSVIVPPSVDAGIAFPMTITYANLGPDPAMGTQLKLILPNDAFLAAPFPGCSRRGAEVTCFVGTVPAGAGGSIDLTMVARAEGSLALNTLIGNLQTELNAADNTAIETITVIPADPAPPSVVMDISPSAVVEEGELVIAEVVDISDPNFGDSIVLDWDLGDGTPAPGNVLFVEHSYADDGLYAVSVTATDSTGLTDTDSVNVEVLNAPPTVNAGPDQTVDMLAPAAFSGQFSDPGVLDTHTILWQFGDGGEAETLDSDHVYAAPGTYFASLVVSDDDGGQGADYLEVSVLPVQLFDLVPQQGLQFSWQEFAPLPTCGSYQFTNTSSIDVDFSLASDVPWLTISPQQGTLPPSFIQAVLVCPENFTTLPPGSYNGTLTLSEGQSGIVQNRPVVLSITAPPGSFPLTFDFLPSLAEEGWELYSSDARGRIQVVDGALRMDASSSGSSVLNEATITVDLANAVNLSLAFTQADFGDEANSMPSTFSGRVNADGVAVSVDGNVWYRVVEPSSLETTATGTDYNVDLDAIADQIRAQFDPAFAYTSETRIRFQQYDNYPHPTDGRSWSNIEIDGVRVDVSVNPQETQVIRVSTDSGETQCFPYTVSNHSSAPRGWSGAVDQSWMWVEPQAGSLGPQSLTLVEVCWNDADAATTLPATATVTFTSESDVFERTIEFVDTNAAFDYSEDFSAGLPGSVDGWSFYSSDSSRGRIDVTNGRLRMDVTPSGAYNLNEAILTLNLAGQAGVMLSFTQAESSDERHALPDQFTGHANGDGVALSADGNTWYTLLNAADLDVGNTPQLFTVDLDAEVARIRASVNSAFTLGDTTQIKFQQYDNYPQTSDGRLWDDVVVTNQ